ncbi:MAG: NAD-dependent malic enzyme [Deltaproteobacteria bacterium]|nr:NAD-dependent malic enzyme [Deltaproteobacteria bacterium]
MLGLEIKNEIGLLGKVTSAIGEAGGGIGAIDLLEVTRHKVVREIVIIARNELHAQQIVNAVEALSDVNVLYVRDRTFSIHWGGKIIVKSKVPLKTRDELSMAYTPGVARICKAIASDRRNVFYFTMKGHMIAVVTDGSAVLGLGNIGPEAALPVMEGKAILFKEFGDVDAFPVCLATQDTDEIISIVKAIAPNFGGINLEDIAAPRCFEIEARLREALDIPVFHDDQHGTAVVILAALINALKIVGKKMSDIKVVITGAGAAGMATAHFLHIAGVKNIICCDRAGAIYEGRKENMHIFKELLAKYTNPDKEKGTANKILQGADVYIGVSAPGAVSVEEIKTMAKDAVVFTLANPEPEVPPEEIYPYVRIVATGRSDYPNQINNVLAFPGIFKGALNCHARQINQEMKLAAAYAIANVIPEEELSEEYIIPSVFNKKVVKEVARAVSRAAWQTKVARKIRKTVSVIEEAD